MASENAEWRPSGPAVCRCCFAEGCYKDISTEYFWMGKREVYAEMLDETFNVTIAFSKWNGPNSTSRLICEACISRLRDASEFKKQVAECERTFMQHLDPGSSSTQLEAVGTTLENLKVETVKEERLLDSDDFDDRLGFDDDDDMDQPLVSLATKVPKKEVEDVLELLKGTDVVVKKRKSVIKLKEAPAKRPKPQKARAPPPPPAPKAEKVVKKKKEYSYGMSANESRRNAWIIIENSTTYPFRLPKDCMVCVYCCDKFEDPSQFRDHMRTEHREFKVHVAFLHHHEGLLKVECSELSCRLCGERFGDLEALAAHLRQAHGLGVDPDHELGLLPFKLQKDAYACVVCGAKSICLRQLSRHTQAHFSKFTCETCAKSYISINALNHHVRYTHVIGERVCRKCKKGFDSREAKRAHLGASPACWPHLCTACGQRFLSWELKQAHLVQAHGLQQKRYACLECGLRFDKRHKYRSHFVLSHTDSAFGCACCSLKFNTRRDLEEHVVVHTKVKTFACGVCDKAFARKKNLTQHMWIHSEYKRFECSICNKKFNQRVSWRTHMKSYHSDLVDPGLGRGAAPPATV